MVSEGLTETTQDRAEIATYLYRLNKMQWWYFILLYATKNEQHNIFDLIM